MAVSRGSTEADRFDLTLTRLVSEKLGRIETLLSLAVVLGIGIVAWSDHAVETISLGYLYLLPLALSALVHPLPISLGLAVLCIGLHDWLGPFAQAEWQHYLWSLTAGVGFAAEILVVNRLARERALLSKTIEKQRDDLARDMKLARDVQRGLLPRRPVGRGLDLASEMFPAKLVSGDFFDYFALPDGTLLLVIGDVSGKGVAAGILTSAVGAALRTETLHELPLDRTVERLNQVLCEITAASRFITLFCAKLHPTVNRLDYVRAGHLPALVYRPSNRESIWLEEGGSLLGVLRDAEFASGSLTLRTGDVLVLYTDGVVDAENADGDPFTGERLADVVRREAIRPAAEILERIRRAAFDFASSHTLGDDATLVVLKVLEGGGAGVISKEGP